LWIIDCQGEGIDWVDATPWSVVLEATQSRAPGGPEALAAIALMFASFQNCIAAEIRLAGTEKRGGRVEVVRLDWEDEEGRISWEPRDGLAPEALYHAQWALTGCLNL
jgi:hypothetical protein